MLDIKQEGSVEDETLDLEAIRYQISTHNPGVDEMQM